MPDSVVVEFPHQYTPSRERIVVPITLEQFCLADEGGAWESRHTVNDIIIIQFPRVVMVCCPMNCCTAITVSGTNIDAYFEAALAALDKVA